MGFKMGSKGINAMFVKKYLLTIEGKRIRKYGLYTQRANKRILS